MFFLPKLFLRILIWGFILLIAIQGVHWGRHWYLKNQIEQWAEKEKDRVLIEGLRITSFTESPAMVMFNSLTFKESSHRIYIEGGSVKFPFNKVSCFHAVLGKVVFYNHDKNTFFATSVASDIDVGLESCDFTHTSFNHVAFLSPFGVVTTAHIKGEGAYLWDDKKLHLNVQADSLELEPLKAPKEKVLITVKGNGDLDLTSPEHPNGKIQIKVKGVRGEIDHLAKTVLKVPPILAQGIGLLKNKEGEVNFPLILRKGKFFLGPFPLN